MIIPPIFLIHTTADLASLVEGPELDGVDEGDVGVRVPIQRVHHHVEPVLLQYPVDDGDYLGYGGSEWTN